MAAQKGGDIMTLGEKISALRAARGMKQDELAAALGVSRQSVSKWETGASVPELDRLVQLAGLFGVTLDELAGLEPPSPEPPPITITRPSARVIVGAVLLGVGLLWTLLYLALWRALPLLGLYLSFCGALCLLIKRRPGLVIGWLTLAALIPFTWRFTSIRMFSVFSPAYYKNTGLAAQLLSWAMWLYLAALTAVTARAAKRPRK